MPSLSMLVSNSDEEVRRLSAELLVEKREISPLWEQKNVSVPSLDSEEVINRLVNETLLRFKLHKINAKIKHGIVKAFRRTVYPFHKGR